MSIQLQHNEIINSTHSFSTVVILDNLRTPENVGMAYRISEAMGVSTIYHCGTTPDITNKKVLKTARHTNHTIESLYYSKTEDAIHLLKSKNYTVIALEITDDSLPLNQMDVKANAKTAIIIGAEREGVQNTTLELCDTAYHIPMYGKNTSINVIQALSIGLYELTNQLSRYLTILLLFFSSIGYSQGEEGWPDLPPLQNDVINVFNPTSFLIVAGAAGASYLIAEKFFDDQNINYYQARIGYYGAQRSTSIILQNFGIEKTVSPWFTIGLEFNSQQWIEGSGSRGNGVGLIGYYRWSLFGKKRWSPYLEYGTGVFQGFKKFPENSSNFTFNLTTNVGLEYTFKNRNKFRAHYGHIHQSNSSLFENNIGIDGNGFGFSYVWHWQDGK